MGGLPNISNTWNNIKEVDLRPLREEALQMVKIALVGASGSGRHDLADSLRCDPSRPEMVLQTPILMTSLENARQALAADLIILVVAPGQAEGAGDVSAEKEALRSLGEAASKTIVLVNQGAGQTPSDLPAAWMDWGRHRVLYGDVKDEGFLLSQLVPVVIEMLPDRLMALGRHFPLFRVTIAQQMINETCFSNAAYSLSTGLAEIVPVFDIPLNVADMVVLSKTQAFLVYKLGLTLGLSTRWQDYVGEFGSVLGGGFLWRQIARSLIGLIPAWGIIPKVAVAYSGTYVVGHVVLQWYLTGRHISKEQMRQLSAQAFTRGRNVAHMLTDRLPKPRLGRGKRGRKGAQPALPPAGSASIELKDQGETPPAAGEDRPALPPDGQICPNCGRLSAPDARFCQYCANPLSSEPAAGSSEEDTAGQV